MKIPDNYEEFPDLAQKLRESLQMNKENKITALPTELVLAKYLVPFNQTGGITLIIKKDKEKFLPVFTSREDAEGQEIPNSYWGILNLQEIHAFAVKLHKEINGIVINPFSQAIELRMNVIHASPSAVSKLKNSITVDQKPIHFESCSTFPIGIPNDLRSFFSTQENVYKSWILNNRQEETGRTLLMILIDFDGDRKQLFSKVADIISPYMYSGQSFQLMKANYYSISKANAICKPFYQKP